MISTIKSPLSPRIVPRFSAGPSSMDFVSDPCAAVSGASIFSDREDEMEMDNP